MANPSKAPHVFSRSIDGSEKVAVLLLALERSKASDLLQRFEPGEIDKIRQAADSLEPITPEDLEAIVEEFADQFMKGANFVGTPGEVHSLLTSALGDSEEAAPEPQAQDEVAEVEKDVWEQIEELETEVLVECLIRECPQTQTFILSRLGFDSASRIVASLPGELRLGVMNRMVSIRPVDPSIVNLLEPAISVSFLGSGDNSDAEQSRSWIAGTINRIDASLKAEIMDGIASLKPEEAAAIRKLMFDFEDIAKLSAKDRMTLLDKVSSDQLVLALNGADANLKELALSALGARARRMAESELSNAGDVPQDNIDSARRAIAAIALDLSRGGEIALPTEEDA